MEASRGPSMREPHSWREYWETAITFHCLLARAYETSESAFMTKHPSESNVTADAMTVVEGRRSSELTISNGTRSQFRERVIKEFLKEDPGTGTGELASKYAYFVETL